MKFLIITPTYNENANISNLISEIREIKTPVNLDILIIDDNSRDGTALTVKAIMAKDKNLHLMQRDAKNGLASA